MENKLLDDLNVIKNKYYIFFNANSTVNEFWNDFSSFLIKIITNPENERMMGKEKVEIIRDYLINIRGEIQGYQRQKALGNHDDANKIEKSIVLIAGEIIRLLTEIMSKEHDDISLLNEKNVVNVATQDFSFDILPIHERPYHAFLSSKDADKTMVDKIYSWLKNVANIPIWYDSSKLPPFARIETELPKAITQCRSMLLILSKSTVSSDWIKKQYQIGIDQQRKFKEFHILPLCIEECRLPDFLGNLNSINIKNNQLDLNTANELLISLFYNDIGTEFEKREIYISRTWRENEAVLADNICKELVTYDFRLIGDSKDQQYFYGKFQERIKSIIASCGGLVAILPHRGNGTTSGPMIEEIETAMDLDLPCIIITEPNVQINGKLNRLSNSILRLDSNLFEKIDKQLLNKAFDKLWDDWKKPISPHEVFYATDFNQQNEKRNQIIQEHIQRITSMPCIIGDKINASNVQKYIINKISNSFMMIADISEGNINTLIESGIALGAGTKLHLIAESPRRDPPFMFADQQVEFYSDDTCLLGIIHRIAYHYRRRVLNYEFTSI